MYCKAYRIVVVVTTPIPTPEYLKRRNTAEVGVTSGGSREMYFILILCVIVRQFSISNDQTLLIYGCVF